MWTDFRFQLQKRVTSLIIETLERNSFIIAPQGSKPGFGVDLCLILILLRYPAGTLKNELRRINISKLLYTGFIQLLKFI